MYKILIIEDDLKLASELKIFLCKNGFEACFLDAFENLEDKVIEINPDILLLDINLPSTDGKHLCKSLRKKTDIPIVMLTSKDSELEELISISYGADDYITKPFNSQIMLARISNILNRYNKKENENKINCGEFVLNIAESKLEKENKAIELSKNEFKILYFLVKNKNKIVSRDDIMDYLWSDNYFVDDNTLTVNITRVRNKLKEIGITDIIVTKRGQGYILK